MLSKVLLQTLQFFGYRHSNDTLQGQSSSIYCYSALFLNNKIALAELVAFVSILGDAPAQSFQITILIAPSPSRAFIHLRVHIEAQGGSTLLESNQCN